MKDIYWIFTNLFVPVLLAPTFFILPAILGTPWSLIRGRLKASIGDGQLLWAAIGIGATGAYDAGMAAFVDHKGDPAAAHIVLVVLTVLVILSSLVVALASEAVFTYEERVRNAYATGQPIPAKQMGSVASFSIAITALVIIMTLLLKFKIAV